MIRRLAGQPNELELDRESLMVDRVRLGRQVKGGGRGDEAVAKFTTLMPGGRFSEPISDIGQGRFIKFIQQNDVLE